MNGRAVLKCPIECRTLQVDVKIRVLWNPVQVVKEFRLRKIPTDTYTHLKPFTPRMMLNKWTVELHCSSFVVFERDVIV